MSTTSARSRRCPSRPGPRPPASPGSGALWFPRSGKVIAGLSSWPVFGALAIIGPLIAPYGPTITPEHHAGRRRDWVQLVKPPAGSPGLPYPVPLPPSSRTSWARPSTRRTSGPSCSRRPGPPSWSASWPASRDTLSVLVGVSAGYLGGSTDEELSLLATCSWPSPACRCSSCSRATCRGATDSAVVIALIVSVTGWAFGARVLRAQTLSLRNREFVEAARVSGESSLRIILFEVLPNLVPIAASSFLFTTLYAIGAYVALSFLARGATAGTGA